MAKIIFDADEDWGKRTLCSDESCIGTIGTDGKCKECGKIYEGELPEAGGAVVVKAAKDDKKPAMKTDNVSDEDWEKRVLCSDESCIGTIDTDGRCRECGKAGK